MEKIIVFGRGGFFRQMEEAIKKEYSIVAFLDNNVRPNEECYEKGTNIPVKNPTEIIGMGEYPILLMIAEDMEPYHQLLELGVNEERIIPGKVFLRSSFRRENPAIDFISKLPTEPVDRSFGGERGKPIDRYYIEQFLDKNRDKICGDTLEIAENTYTMRYGDERVRHSYILHVKGWGGNDVIKGNLETGEGLQGRSFDTLILTQTLMFTYELQEVAKNIHAILKNDGYALITVSGISQISRYDANNWGSFFCFHEDAMKRLFIPLFGEQNVSVESYGNVKTAAAMLYGLCCEDLDKSDFERNDEDYPNIIAVLLHKSNA